MSYLELYFILCHVWYIVLFETYVSLYRAKFIGIRKTQNLSIALLQHKWLTNIET